MDSILTAEWLVDAEHRYGGYVEMAHANGGDRMAVHGYAQAYADTINAYTERHGWDLTLVEVGVLRGTGLAIWCDLFPRVYGLDIRPEVFHDYRDELVRAGAFSGCEPVVAYFDQARATPRGVAELVRGPVHIVIDDGSHHDMHTLRTLEAFRPHLADEFLYFVEDSPRGSRIHRDLMRDALGFTATRLHRSLTVLTR